MDATKPAHYADLDEQNEDGYTVQQAAAMTGLSEHTLRYYERIGLMARVSRQGSSGHRRYSASDIARLDVFACLRAAGMPIEQMRTYSDLLAKGASAAREQQELFASHRRVLEAERDILQRNIDFVSLKIAYWQAVEAGDKTGAARIAQEARARIMENSHSK
jgi:DNA-binding transcriptional MerR regulator